MPGDEYPTLPGRARLPPWAILTLAVPIIVLGLKIAQRVQRDMNSPEARLAACERPLHGDAGISMMKNQYKIDEVHIDFAMPGSPLNMNRAAYDAFVDCLRKNRLDFVIEDGWDIAKPTTLGEVARDWQFFPGPKLVLRPDNGAVVLRNMKFGPAVGATASILADWCGRGQAGDCVTCEPSAPDRNAASVEISLKANAPVVRTPLHAAASNGDQEDKPSVYECRP